MSPAPGTVVLDLACGSGEMLCTWARDHRVTGTGVDISTVFLGFARARAAELGVAGRVSFVHGDASGYVASPAAGIAACLGATWIGGGVAGTVGLLRPGLRVQGVAAHPGVFEMTWDNDGHATFSYGPERTAGQPHVIWRRIGTRAIFTPPPGPECQPPGASAGRSGGSARPRRA